MLRNSRGTWHARLVKHATLNLGDMSSSPTLGVDITLKKKEINKISKKRKRKNSRARFNP